jgi:uncharacterized protein YndB with AHSA1/START domain
MPSASRTITIFRPVAEVFAFFTDPANDPKWRPSVKEITADGAPAVGKIIHQVVAGPGGRGIPADIRITAYEPDRHFAFQVIAGPVRPSGSMTFTAKGEDTEVTFSVEAEISGVKKLLLSGPVQKSMDAEMAALDTARHLLDAGL